MCVLHSLGRHVLMLANHNCLYANAAGTSESRVVDGYLASAAVGVPSWLLGLIHFACWIFLLASTKLCLMIFFVLKRKSFAFLARADSAGRAKAPV
jgi:hypothetical protein